MAKPRTLYVRPQHDDIWLKAEAFAAHTGISVSTLVAWALEEWLKPQRGGGRGSPTTPVRLPRLPTPDQK